MFLLSLAQLRILLRLMILAGRLLQTSLTHFELKICLCSTANFFDGNAILQSIIAFPVTFKDQTKPVINQALKAVHAGFVTDTYTQCISSSL